MTARLPTRRPGTAVLTLAVLLLVAAGAAALVAGRPPAAVPADAPAAEFSAGRAASTVAAIAGQPRPLGSPASDRVRDDLVARLRALGLQTRLAPAMGANAEGGTASVGRVENVVAVRRGTDPTGAVVLMAHYDSVPSGPGAADDASGVAAVLETVRALRSAPAPRNDVVVLLTDGEEDGLLGAEAFVRDDPLRGRPAVVLNWEARGSGGPSLLFQTSPGNAPLVDAYRAVPHPGGDSSLAAAYALMPNDTDLSPFLSAGRPGLNSAFLERAGTYHAPVDTPANLDPRSVQQHGTSMLALAGVLGAADLGPMDPGASGAPTPGDVTYVALFGHLWVYGNQFVLPIAALGVLVLLLAVALARRRHLLTFGGLSGALVSLPVVLLLAALLGEGCWRALVLLRPGYANGGGFPLRPGPMQVAVLLLGVLAVLLWGLALRRRLGAWAMGLGAGLWLALLGVVLAVPLPGASFLVALPAVGLGVGAVVASVLPPVWRPLPVAVGALPAVVLLVPFAVALFDAAGLAGSALPAAGAALAAAPLALLVAGRRLPLRVPVALVVAAAVLAGLGVWLDRPDPAHPDRADLAYLLDAGSGTARWISRDSVPSAWTARYVTGQPVAPGGGLPWPGDEPVRTGPAPVLDTPAPGVGVTRLPDGSVELRTASRRGATTLGVRADTAAVTSAEVTYVGQRTVVVPVRGPLDLRLSAVPRGGVRIVLRTSDRGPLGLVVHDRTTGLSGISGWFPRPPELTSSARPDADAIVVARSVTG